MIPQFIVQWFSPEIPVEIEIKQTIDKWRLMHFSNEEVVSNLQKNIEKKITYEILNEIDVVVDKAVLEAITKEMVDNFDFKTAIQSAMHNKLKYYLART